MDKVSRIAAAALLASSLAYATPTFAVQTTAEDFLVGLSADFSSGNYQTVVAKLEELKGLGFEGFIFGTMQMITIDELIALLNQVQGGDLAGASVAAAFLAYLDSAESVRFVMGGMFTTTADLNVGTTAGSIFPAGSAG